MPPVFSEIIQTWFQSPPSYNFITLSSLGFLLFYFPYCSEHAPSRIHSMIMKWSHHDHCNIILPWLIVLLPSLLAESHSCSPLNFDGRMVHCTQSHYSSVIPSERLWLLQNLCPVPYTFDFFYIISPFLSSFAKVCKNSVNMIFWCECYFFWAMMHAMQSRFLAVEQDVPYDQADQALTCEAPAWNVIQMHFHQFFQLQCNILPLCCLVRFLYALCRWTRQKNNWQKEKCTVGQSLPGPSDDTNIGKPL